MSRGGEIEVFEIEPPPDVAGFLPGYDFADAYRVSIGEIAIDARAAAQAMMARQPTWIGALMRLRNIIVAPFGLETDTSKIADRVSFFPVLEESGHRIVLGLDDLHLDFRLIVDVRETGLVHDVVATTLVERHNFLGCVYLAVIMPFHRSIMRSMLQRLPANLAASRLTTS